MYRTFADGVRTEKTLHQRIAQQYPALHQSEARARAEVQQAPQARAARVEQ